MTTLTQGYRAVSILMMLSADRFLTTGLVAAALCAGALIFSG